MRVESGFTYALSIYLNGPFSKVGSNGSTVWRSSGIEVFVISAETVNAGKASVTIALMAKSECFLKHFDWLQ